MNCENISSKKEENKSEKLNFDFFVVQEILQVIYFIK